MKKDEVCSVRVSLDTRMMLLAEIRRLADWCEKHPDCDIRDNLDNRNPACEEISVDRFLRHLLEQRQGHRERRRKYRRARAGHRNPSRRSVENAGRAGQ